MVKYLYSLDNSQPMNINIKTGGAVTAGQLVKITSGLAVAAGAAATGVLGIAMQDGASGDFVQVLLLNPKSVIRLTYTAGTKTDLADADKFGTAFDLDADQKMLLDDVTGGYVLVVKYDNVALTADVVIKASALWNA